MYTLRIRLMFIKHHPFLIHCIYTSPPQRDGIPCYSRTGTGASSVTVSGVTRQV